MIIGLHKDATRHFILTEDEYVRLIEGEKIVKRTECFSWKKAKFTLSFEGEKRN